MAPGTTVIQRFGGALNLNVRFHSLLPDGVFVRDEALGRVRFVRVPAPTTEEVERLVEQVASRVTRWLAKRGIGEDEPAVEDDPDDAGLLLQAASAAGRAALGRRYVPEAAGAPVRLPLLFAVSLITAACSGSKADTAVGLDGGPADGADGTGADGTDGADGTGGADGTDPATDGDGDGLSEDEGDCDDTDPLVYPGATERCNGVDDDCSGAPHPLEGSDGADCAACADGGWWEPAKRLADDQVSTRADLLEALATGWATAPCSNYEDARDTLFSFESNGTGTVTTLYTGEIVDVSGGVDFDEVNPEHTWPRSDGADGNPEECDLHHLFVASAAANTRRGNYPFGLVDDVVWEEGGSALGDNTAGERVFEPRPEARGDVARAMLYFAARYGSGVSEGDLNKHLQTSRYLEWHTADPVTPDEAARSVALGGTQDGLANPFVVCSGWVERWAE